MHERIHAVELNRRGSNGYDPRSPKSNFYSSLLFVRACQSILTDFQSSEWHSC